MTAFQHVLMVATAVLVGEFFFVLTGFLPRPDLPLVEPHDVRRALAWSIPVGVLTLIELELLVPLLDFSPALITWTLVLILLVGFALFGISLMLLRLRELPSAESAGVS